MPIVKKKYIMACPGGNRLIILPESYDSIKSHLGLSNAPANSTAPQASPNDLRRTGQAVIVRIRRKVGTKYVTNNVICSANKAGTVCVQLIGKNFGQGSTAGVGNIVGAYYPRNRRLG